MPSRLIADFINTIGQFGLATQVGHTSALPPKAEVQAPLLVCAASVPPMRTTTRGKGERSNCRNGWDDFAWHEISPGLDVTIHIRFFVVRAASSIYRVLAFDLREIAKDNG